MDEKYIFKKGYDQLNNDINYYDLNLNSDDINDINKIFQKVLLNDNCVGFNTLGFFKSNIDVNNLTKSIYYKNENDGIYIKKDYYLKNKLKKIKMICNWCSSSVLCNEFNNMSKGNYKWNNLVMTDEKDSENIDYYVIINSNPYNEYYEANKTIVFQMEPWIYDMNKNWGVKTWGEWAIPDENKFLKVIGRKTQGEVCNIYWQLELTYNELLNLKYENKINEISCICSSKYNDEGHIHRINFIKYLDKKTDIPAINIFGKSNPFSFKNYKGQLDMNEKSKGILPYKYYFMVENSYEEDYLTEKLTEPILCETLCFYYGCPNVTKYINPNSFVQLDMYDFSKSYNIIKQAIEEDWWSKYIDNIRIQKNIILNELQFFPRIEKIINDYENKTCK